MECESPKLSTIILLFEISIRAASFQQYFLKIITDIRDRSTEEAPE
jgi:hypothetical protein